MHANCQLLPKFRYHIHPHTLPNSVIKQGSRDRRSRCFPTRRKWVIVQLAFWQSKLCDSIFNAIRRCPVCQMELIRKLVWNYFTPFRGQNNCATQFSVIESTPLSSRFLCLQLAYSYMWAYWAMSQSTHYVMAKEFHILCTVHRLTKKKDPMERRNWVVIMNVGATVAMCRVKINRRNK